MSEKYDYTYEGSEGYCYSGTNVLINKLHIKDDDTLTIAEREITSLKLLILYNMPILEEYDFTGLCKIHKIIFSDIYEWAGEIRKGDFFSKGNSIFCRGQYIRENAKNIFENINKENNLCGLRKQKFIERMAYYMGEVNALHPFREGNGRTLREFFRQFSLNANFVLDFSKTDNEKLLLADIDAFNGQYCNSIKILDKAIIEK
jgi:cell filamentation protein